MMIIFHKLAYIFFLFLTTDILFSGYYPTSCPFISLFQIDHTQPIWRAKLNLYLRLLQLIRSVKDYKIVEYLNPTFDLFIWKKSS